MKLCLIGVDGVRWDKMSLPGVAPWMMKLAAEGSVTPMWMIPPTDSGPGWASLLTGCTHEETRVWDNEFVAHQLGRCPDILSRAWMRDFDTTTMAAVTWRQLADPRGRGPVIHTRPDQIRAGLHRLVIKDGEATGCVVADEEVQVEAARIIVEEAPDVSFVYFEGVDEAGHTYGSVGQEYLDAISRVDELVRCVWKAVDERVRLHDEDWLIAICTDHGHKDEGGHGEDEEQVRRSFLILNRFGRELPDTGEEIAPTDVTPLLLSALERG